MAAKSPQQQLQEFDNHIAQLNELSIANNSLNVSSSEQNVVVDNEPLHNHAAATSYVGVEALFEGDGRKQLALIKKWDSLMVASDKVLKKGKELCVFLYTFRGLSATLSFSPTLEEPGPDATKEELDAFKRKKVEATKLVKSKAFDLLTPYMVRLDELRQFNIDVGELLTSFLTRMEQELKRGIPSRVKERAVELVDVLAQIDNLKDMKVCAALYE